jgi:hypothetical protein
MASVIQVANRALTKLGSARITSLDDDVKAARSISSCFDDLRDEELRAHRWSFSLKRASLASLIEVPVFGWDLQYQVPADFLKLDMVNDQFPSTVLENYIGQELVDYVLEGNKILTNIGSPLKLRYIAQITDPNQWDPCFREALACRIAAELAEDLTQNASKRQLAWEEYKMSMVAAIRSNAVERQPVMLGDDAWVIGRI